MPVFMLSEALSFPDPEDASEEGLLAIGGDLSPQRLVLAYSQGIFPWYSDGDPLMWWSPEPRMVIRPGEYAPPRSLRRLHAKNRYRISMDEAFESVLRYCSEVPRRGQDGTWITNEMTEAYLSLHQSGIGHSVECWEEDTLVGGLYGLSLGNCFFGESMFSKRSNTSKLAFWALMRYAEEIGLKLIDCQLHNDHLERLGAYPIPRSEFLKQLYTHVHAETRIGSWTKNFATLRNSD